MRTVKRLQAVLHHGNHPLSLCHLNCIRPAVLSTSLTAETHKDRNNSWFCINSNPFFLFEVYEICFSLTVRHSWKQGSCSKSAAWIGRASKEHVLVLFHIFTQFHFFKIRLSEHMCLTSEDVDVVKFFFFFSGNKVTSCWTYIACFTSLLPPRVPLAFGCHDVMADLLSGVG